MRSRPKDSEVGRDLRSPIAATGEDGFSLVELITATTISLVILAAVVVAFSNALRTRDRAASQTDAITSTQAAINIVSREIANSGFGLTSNGIVVADSGGKRIHIRSNFINNDYYTNSPGEELVIYYDADSESVLQYDVNTDVTSGIINRVSDVDFEYFSNSFTGEVSTGTTPSAETTRIKIKLKVLLPNVQSQPADQETVFVTDVTLRNSPYILSQY